MTAAASGRSPTSAASAEGRLRSLHPCQQRLVELMCWIEWGRVEDLLIRSGLPVLGSRERYFRRLRPDQPDAPRRPKTSGTVDFKLRRCQRQLLECCRRIDHGLIKRIEVSNGLPVFWEPAMERT